MSHTLRKIVKFEKKFKILAEITGEFDFKGFKKRINDTFVEILRQKSGENLLSSYFSSQVTPQSVAVLEISCLIKI